MTPDPADLRAFLAQSNNGQIDPHTPPPSPFPPRMTHLPRTFDEIPESIADLPDMTVDDARNMDKDIFGEMFGGANPSLVPAWAAIERMERNKKWAKEQQAQAEAAERQQQRTQGPSTRTAPAAQGDDLNWFERKAQQADGKPRLANRIRQTDKTAAATSSFL